MKKLMKRIVPLFLAMVMCICMAAPAFAMDSPYYGHFRSFPQIAYGSSGGAVIALQHFLGRYSYSTYSALGSSGCDGSFGPATKSSLIKFQTATMGASSADGICGPNTWGKVADGMSTSSRLIDFACQLYFTCSKYSSSFSDKIVYGFMIFDANTVSYSAYHADGTTTSDRFYTGQCTN